MKRILTAVLALALAFSATACGRGNTSGTTGMENYKIGVANYTHTDNSYGYTEGKNGRGAVSTTYVAAVFDNSGKIVKIAIDEVESNINFDATGQLADYAGGEVLSKKELGDNYGMKAASGIGKEWHEQIASLEKWLEGKDVNTIISSAQGRINSITGSNTNSGSGAMSGDNSASGTMSDGTAAGGMTGTDSMTNGTNSGGMMGDVMSGANSIMDGVTDGMDNMTGNMTGGNMTGNMTGWMDEDLKASVTIDTTYIVRAIEKAYKNAK